MNRTNWRGAGIDQLVNTPLGNDLGIVEDQAVAGLKFIPICRIQESLDSGSGRHNVENVAVVNEFAAEVPELAGFFILAANEFLGEFGTGALGAEGPERVGVTAAKILNPTFRYRWRYLNQQLSEWKTVITRLSIIRLEDRSGISRMMLIPVYRY